MKNRIVILIIGVVLFCSEFLSQETYIECFNTINKLIDNSDKNLTTNYGLRFGHLENKISVKVGMTHKNVYNQELIKGHGLVTNKSFYGIAVFSLGYSIINKNKLSIIPHFNVTYATLVRRSLPDKIDRFQNPKIKSFITQGMQIDFNYQILEKLTVSLAPHFDYNLSKSLNYRGSIGTQIGFKLKV